MFWNLVLAHMLGDFVLQTDWIVRKRDNLWVLSLHAGIHFLLMFLLVGVARTVVWPYLLLLAFAHLAQDRIKNTITNKRPDLIRVSFVIDQFIHFFTIGIVIWLLQNMLGLLPTTQKIVWVMIAIAYLFVTYVWFITERLFNLSDIDYLQNLNITKYSRMLSRGALVSLFLVIQAWTTSGLTLVLSNPYAQTKFRRRALLTDFSVSLFAILFLAWALG
ncbi:MAG: DUF3307 domain-containing protein [Anaerolineales bacterium]|jgi:hypothetical protein